MVQPVVFRSGSPKSIAVVPKNGARNVYVKNASRITVYIKQLFLDIHTRNVYQPNHSFVKPSIAYLDVDQKYQPVERAVPAKRGAILISRVIDSDNFAVALSSQVYEGIPIENAAPDRVVYVGATPGSLTCDYPELAAAVIRVGRTIKADEFHYIPDKVIGVGQ